MEESLELSTPDVTSPVDLMSRMQECFRNESYRAIGLCEGRVPFEWPIRSEFTGSGKMWHLKK